MDPLEHEMRQVLASMACISYGATAAWNSSGRGKAGSKPPTGEAWPLHEEWTQRWNDALSDLGRGHVLSEARDALNAWRVSQGATGPLETWPELAARIVKEGAGWTVGEVAEALKVGENEVRKARRELKCDLTYGRPTADLEKLKDSGLSVREIALRTGMPKSTVHDFLKPVRLAA